MSKPDREHSARGRLAKERALRAARERRRRLLVVVLGGVLVAALVVVVVVVTLERGGEEEPPAVFQGALAPATREADGAVAMAKPGVTRPVLEVFEDFQCPVCRELESRQGATFKELAAAGKAKVVYRPFQLFRQEPLASNSRRAANAAACAPADRWVRYHDEIYAGQPPEGEVGFANADLIKWAGAAGITGAPFSACVNGAQQAAAVDRAGAQAERAGATGTPYLTLDGAKLSDDALNSPDELRKVVEEAGRKAPGGGTVTLPRG